MINFPTTPALNDVYTFGTYSWKWDGSGWQRLANIALSVTSGTVTSVGVSSVGTYAGALTIGSSPITGSGTITITPNLFSSVEAGIVPASGGGTTNFLRADGTWVAAGAAYTALIGDGVATNIVVTHNLGNQWVTVQLVDVVNNEIVGCRADLTSSSTCTLRFVVAPTTNQYRVTVRG